jgi:hypothetical protein
MGRIYELIGENLTLTTAVTNLAAFQTAAAAAAGALIRLKRLEISQSGTTTLQMIRGEISTRNTSGTLTSTSQAPVSVQPAGGVASGLAGNTSVIGGAGRSGINASVDSGGAYTQLHPFNFANTAGYLWKPAPDEEILIMPSTVCTVRLLANPTTLTGWTFALTLEEF